MTIHETTPRACAVCDLRPRVGRTHLCAVCTERHTTPAKCAVCNVRPKVKHSDLCATCYPDVMDRLFTHEQGG